MRILDTLKAKLHQFSPQTRWYVLNNFIWLTTYLIIIQQYGWPTEEVLFSTPDSKSYLAAGNYFFGANPTYATLYRPFLYPVVLKALLILGGAQTAWIFQAMLWLASVNLLYYSCKRIFKHSLLPVLISLIFGLNISLIAITMHALTEVLTTFGISVYIFFVVKNYKRGLSRSFMLGSLMIFGLLTVVKPLYYLVVIAILGIIIYRWRIYQGKTMLLKIFVILIPIFIQMGIVFFAHNQITISRIGSSTFKTNFIANGYGLMNGLKLHEAQKEIRNFSDNEIYKLLSENKWHFIKSYFRNLHAHLNGHPSYVNIPKGIATLSVFMARYNRIIFWLHLLFSPLLLYHILSKRDRPNLFLVVALSLPWFLIAFTSGISVNQGDRLVLPGLSLCFVLYPLFIHSFWQTFKIKNA